MIYICEYDDEADDRLLQERPGALLLQYTESDRTGIRWRKMRERILARLLLDYALKKEYGISFPELELYCDAHGKPHSRAYPDIHFNISHCSVACACAVGKYPVGIDIERKFDYRENLARKVCHPKEWSALQELEPEIRSEQMHFLWSLKESFVKWDGKGLSYGMERIDLSQYLPIELDTGQSCRLDRFLLHCGEAFTMAVCSDELPEEGAPGAICGKREIELL